MRRIALIGLLAALGAWPGASQADRVTRGTVIQATDVVASEQRLLLVHSVRRTNTLLPPYLVRLELRFPPGTQVHTGGLPRCDLAALQAKGTSACPGKTRVGSASITGRTSLDPGGVGAKAAMFNGERIGSRRTMLMFVDPELGPSFVAIGKLYRSRRAGVRMELDFPTIKTLLGLPDEALSDFALRFDTDFVRAPCPGRYRVTSHFLDGEPSLTSSDRARCR